MAEEIGTKDVLEQVNSRLGTLEQDFRSLDAKMDARFDRMGTQLGTTTRWLVGLVFTSWLTMMASMASIWLKLVN